MSIFIPVTMSVIDKYDTLRVFFIKNEVFLRTENDIFLIKIVDMYMLYTYMFMCVYTL